MAYTTINKSTDYFNTVLYTGNATARSITGVGHQPDLVWIKPRDNGTWSNNLTDVVRGAGYGLFSDLTNAQYNYGTGTDGSVRTFDSDGFSLGNKTQVNNNGSNIVAWNWKAGGGQGSSNTDGSINTTYTSVNTTAGFSISQYTGTGSVGTIGHGLGAVPKMIITKPYSTTGQWYTYHASLGNTHYLDLVSTAAAGDDAEMWNDTSPTSSVFTVGVNGNTNGSGKTTIAYCFAEKKGFSKFGSYTGNGNADGTFVYTGFKPAFMMIKITSGTSNWRIFDNKRIGYNVDNNPLYPNVNNAEGTEDNIDILSNGFKWRTTDGALNGSGSSYIFMAFAEAPLVGTNGVTAKAR
jgi:hypothetical protein